MVSQGHALSRDELVRALVSHTGIATADGAVTNDSLIDSNLIGWDQRKIVEKTILISSGDSNLEDAAATVFNPVTGEITISPAFSNQILAGTVYRIINISTVELDVLHILTRIGTNVDPAGTTTIFAWLAQIWAGLLGGQGLCYGGTVTAAVPGVSFTIASLAGLGATKFASTTQPPYRAYVLREALGGIGGAPQGEMAAITGYTTATGRFTPNAPAFTVDIAVDDEVLILHPRIAEILDILQDMNVPVADVVDNVLLRDVIGNKTDTAIFAADNVSSIMRYLKGLIPLHPLVSLIFDLVNAIFTMKETGGTITLDGTVQDIYRNETPMGVFKPKIIKLHLNNLTAAEIVVVRLYYRIISGGVLTVLEDEVTYAGVQVNPSKTIKLDPNRFGVLATIERTAGGAIDINHEEFYED